MRGNNRPFLSLITHHGLLDFGQARLQVAARAFARDGPLAGFERELAEEHALLFEHVPGALARLDPHRIQTGLLLAAQCVGERALLAAQVTRERLLLDPEAVGERALLAVDVIDE